MGGVISVLRIFSKRLRSRSRTPPSQRRLSTPALLSPKMGQSAYPSSSADLLAAYDEINYYSEMNNGTVFAHADFDVSGACEVLGKSMKGWGTDEDTLAMILVEHNNEQRQEIKDKYTAMFGEDLVEQIKGEVGGHFEELLVGLLTKPVTYEAQALHNAMKGAGTSEDVIIEVLVGKSNDEINSLKEEYERLFETSLEDSLDGDCSGTFLRICRALTAGARDEGGDHEDAEADAQELFEAGVNSFGTDESKFVSILCSRSYAHVRRVVRRYRQLSQGTDLEEAIGSEFTGADKEGLLAIVKEASDTPAFFAERLNAAMSGVGTTDTNLIRIIVSRSEIDLKFIMESYQTIYENSLAETIRSEASGDYEKALLLVLGERE